MKTKIIILALIFTVIQSVGFSGSKNTTESLYDFLKQFKEGNGDGIKKNPPPPFLLNYIKYVYSKDKKIISTGNSEDDFIYKIMDSAYFPEKFDKKWREQLTNEREKAFFFLALARNTVFFKEETFALKFFFQSFLIFTNWKDTYPISDKIVFINEWFYHFSASFAQFKDKIDQTTYEYYTSLIISCTDLLYNIPYYFHIHPKADINFTNDFIKTNAEMVSKIDDQYKLISVEKFKQPILKMFLINTMLFMSDRNYLKADFFSSKLLSYFNNSPITEEYFIIYEEALKNKILINFKLSRLDQSLIFLNKFLSYSQACDRLIEKWSEMKEILMMEKRYDEFMKNPKTKKMLSDYKISQGTKNKKMGKYS